MDKKLKVSVVVSEVAMYVLAMIDVLGYLNIPDLILNVYFGIEFMLISISVIVGICGLVLQIRNLHNKDFCFPKNNARQDKDISWFKRIDGELDVLVIFIILWGFEHTYARILTLTWLLLILSKVISMIISYRFKICARHILISTTIRDSYNGKILDEYADCIDYLKMEVGDIFSKEAYPELKKLADYYYQFL